MTSVTYLPLDDRPLNYTAVARAAALSRIPVAIPPRELVGTRGGTPSQLESARWLAANTDTDTELVLSLDALLHGGLIQARSGQTDEQRVDTGLNLLAKLVERAGRVSAHFIWKRLWGNIFRQEELDLMPRWMELSHALAQLLGPHGDPEDLYLRGATGGLGIPGWPRDDLAVLSALRLRQLHEARAALRLCGHQGMHLHLALEDCVPGGVQERELEWLRAQFPAARVTVADGGDEAGAVLLAGAVARVAELSPLPVVTHGLRNRAAPYESRPVQDNLQVLCQLAEAKRTRAAPGFALQIRGTPQPGDGFVEVLAGRSAPADFREVRECIRPLQEFTEQVVVDLTATNGVNPGLLAEFLCDPAPPLAIVQGNTASNRIGHGLLLAQMLRGAQEDDGAARLVVAHFCEDLLYQAYLRTWALQRYGGLEPRDNRVLGEAENSLSRMATEIARRKFDGARLRGRLLKVRDVRLRLPWRRWFEAAAAVEVELQ